jgi:hypothetical protein
LEAGEIGENRSEFLTWSPLYLKFIVDLEVMFEKIWSFECGKNLDKKFRLGSS